MRLKKITLLKNVVHFMENQYLKIINLHYGVKNTKKLQIDCIQNYIIQKFMNLD